MFGSSSATSNRASAVRLVGTALTSVVALAVMLSTFGELAETTLILSCETAVRDLAVRREALGPPSRPVSCDREGLVTVECVQPSSRCHAARQPCRRENVSPHQARPDDGQA